jgi:AcrR family transcriptional regulator
MFSGSDTVHRRARPVQARSAATLETILAAATALLVERGLPCFNTNAVARAAGVNVATLYHYFPHKTAILRELFERNERERSAFVLSRLDGLAGTDDPAGWVGEMVATLLHLRRGQPAGPALRRACRAVPELIEAEEAVNEVLAEQLGEALKRRYPRIGARRAKAAARVMVEVTGTLLDLAGAQPASAGAIAVELESLMRGYFADLAEANGAPTPDR